MSTYSRSTLTNLVSKSFRQVLSNRLTRSNTSWKYLRCDFSLIYGFLQGTPKIFGCLFCNYLNTFPNTVVI